MARVKCRHEKHAEECRDGKIVPERCSQLHLLIVNEIGDDKAPSAVKWTLTAVEPDASDDVTRSYGGACY
jgi:hypothetical protein